MKASIILAVLALCYAGCGAQGSTMAPTYLGEGQGIASQLMGMVSQLQNYQYEQQLMRQQQQQLQHQQQQQWGNP